MTALQRMCRTWQRRLRLQDWRVEIQYATEAEMEGCYGFTHYDAGEMLAAIRILDVLDPATREATVIHELLHLRLYQWEAPLNHPPQEQAINLLADSLQAAYRRRKA